MPNISEDDADAFAGLSTNYVRKRAAKILSRIDIEDNNGTRSFSYVVNHFASDF